MSGSKAPSWISNNAVSLRSGTNLDNPVICGIKGGKTTASGVGAIPDSKAGQTSCSSKSAAFSEPQGFSKSKLCATSLAVAPLYERRSTRSATRSTRGYSLGIEQARAAVSARQTAKRKGGFRATINRSRSRRLLSIMLEGVWTTR
jgi:hypothetical protein